MLHLLSVLVAAGLSLGPSPMSDGGPTATVFSTVGQSEFCPPGNVQADLTSGTYAYTAKASRGVCQNVGLERPIRRGRLQGARLLALQEAYRRAQTEGLDRCRNGGTPGELLFSNGGIRVLLVTDGRQTQVAPDALGCWSDAALELHDVLERTFERPSAH